ncbi:hypothetical protein MCMEM_2046 [Methanococcoides methylutens MM1]|uniref:histidine kinase n=1 Tax=Methanococcoides methylutens MM1 TaxID=1434104 RepID=A0A0E3X157_METMT|nr:hypothetical protein MCMEM_2046 [Methanococcoides methylutens MM1]
MDEALKQTKELELVINSSPVVVFLWKNEPNWPVEVVSDNILQFGYTANELISGEVLYSDIIYPDDLEYVRSTFEKKPGETNKGLTADYRIITKSGDVRWVRERTLIRRDEDGKISHYQGIILDITERKKAEDALRLDEFRLEALLKLNKMTAAPLQEITDFAREEAVKLTRSKQGYLAFMSPDEGALIMHSWSKDAMKECAIEDRKFIYPIETTGLWGEAVKQRKPIITNDYQAPSSLKKGYPQGHVELTRHMNVPIFDGNRIVAVAGVGNKEEDYDESDLRQLILLMQGMWRLIQRKQMEEALQKYSQELSKAEVELKSLDRMEADFVSSKKDVSQVTEYGELIDGETLDIIDDLKKKAIDNVLHNSQRLRRLVDSFVYTSMEEADKIEYNFEPIDISGPLEDSLLDTIFIVEEKDILVEKTIPEQLPLVDGDEEKLIDMFTVLLDDAIRFTPPKGKLTIKIDAEENDLHIMVKDSGPGIPKKLIPHMFQRFYEIGASIKQSYEGLESGLYICKKIVDAHEGRIKIESKIGAGTAVHVWLPKIK